MPSHAELRIVKTCHEQSVLRLKYAYSVVCRDEINSAPHCGLSKSDGKMLNPETPDFL
jgi:hypothetical protein